VHQRGEQDDGDDRWAEHYGRTIAIVALSAQIDDVWQLLSPLAL
jgi:hypothetical protein